LGPNPTRPRLAFSLFIAILAVSTASVLIRFAQQDAPSLTIAALRLAFATALLAPVAFRKYRPQLFALTAGELLLAGLSGLLLAIHFGTWISSLEYTSVASSVVLVSTGPIWVALLSSALLKEHVAPVAVLGLFLSVLGAVTIGAADLCSWAVVLECSTAADLLRGQAVLGDALALAGALAVSGYLMLGRRLRATMPLVPYVFIVYGFAAIGLLVAVAATGGTLVGYRPLTYLWLLLLALVPQLIGHSTYNWALRFLPATFVSVLGLGEPIGSAILAYFILSEQPGSFVLLGGAFVLLGIYLVSRGVRQRNIPLEV
jgi:drug/metabolite transporter (DMT)-like permease